MSARRHVFGPVMSGRLGRSLGVDPLGARICSLDCTYCEVGATQALTVLRKPYAPAETVLGELADWKAEARPAPDVITLGGLGEPTLSRECGLIIAGAKGLFPGVPVAVLTNATLLWDPEVRAGLMGADMVLPSMDTLVEEEFQVLSRPHPDLDLETIARGLLTFRAEYPGLIFLEVLLLAGVNDGPTNLERLRAYVAELRPDRVDVTTLSRPGTDPNARPADKETLERFRAALGSETRASVAGAPAVAGSAGDIAWRVADSIERRPQTANGLAEALAAPVSEVEAALEALIAARRVRRHQMSGETFFLPTLG